MFSHSLDIFRSVRAVFALLEAADNNAAINTMRTHRGDMHLSVLDSVHWVCLIVLVCLVTTARRVTRVFTMSDKTHATNLFNSNSRLPLFI